jgi:hypothetical protein
MRRNVIVGLSVPSFALAVVLYILILKGKVDIAQAIQIIITFVLVLVTYIYVLRTAEIADATKEQAEATGQQAKASLIMAEEMKKQRYDTVLPIIDIQRVEFAESKIREGLSIEEGKSAIYLTCKITNVGVGPAIDVNLLTINQSGDTEKQELGTLGIKDDNNANILIQKSQYSEYLAVRYRDIYGRFLSSQRPIFLSEKNRFSLGPLKIEQITGEKIS